MNELPQTTHLRAGVSHLASHKYVEACTCTYETFPYGESTVTLRTSADPECPFEHAVLRVKPWVYGKGETS